MFAKSANCAHCWGIAYLFTYVSRIVHLWFDTSNVVEKVLKVEKCERWDHTMGYGWQIEFSRFFSINSKDFVLGTDGILRTMWIKGIIKSTRYSLVATLKKNREDFDNLVLLQRFYEFLSILCDSIANFVKLNGFC